MGLSEACDAFVHSVSRQDIARACTDVVAVSQPLISQGGVTDVDAPRMMTAIAWCRRASLNHSVADTKNWIASDTLSTIDGGPWDSFHWLLFLCQCHLRVCFARLFSDSGSWKESWNDCASWIDDDFDALRKEECENIRKELEKGVEPESVTTYLSQSVVERVGMSLSVCLQGVVQEEHQDEPFFRNARLTKIALRLLEKKCLGEDILRETRKTIAALDPEPDQEALKSHSSHVLAWGKKTISVDANNQLLLRMDEWAVAKELDYIDVCKATGDRGCVPQEHRNSPAAWVAQRALPDAEYQRLMRDAKNNGDIPENLYVAFSGTLEQHYNFDWLTKCFVVRLDPPKTLRKLAEYLNSARSTTPPLVVQGSRGKSTVIVRVQSCDSDIGRNFRRVECETPAEAISAWLSLVERHCGGSYTRKANVRDIIERVKNASETPLPEDDENMNVSCVPIEETDR